MKFFKNLAGRFNLDPIYLLKFPLVVTYYYVGKTLIYNKHKDDIQSTANQLKNEVLQKLEHNLSLINQSSKNSNHNKLTEIESILSILISQTEEIRPGIEKLLNNNQEAINSLWNRLEDLKTGKINVLLSTIGKENYSMSDFNIDEELLKFTNHDTNLLLFTLVYKYFEYLNKEGRIKSICNNLNYKVKMNSEERNIKELSRLLEKFNKPSNIQPLEILYSVENEFMLSLEVEAVSNLALYLILNLLGKDLFTEYIQIFSKDSNSSMLLSKLSNNPFNTHINKTKDETEIQIRLVGKILRDSLSSRVEEFSREIQKQPDNTKSAQILDRVKDLQDYLNKRL